MSHRFTREQLYDLVWSEPMPKLAPRFGVADADLADTSREAIILSLAKTSSDSLRSTEIRHSVHGPKTPSLVGGKATGIVRPSALHGHTGVAMEGAKRAG